MPENEGDSLDEVHRRAVAERYGSNGWWRTKRVPPEGPDELWDDESPHVIEERRRRLKELDGR